MSTAVTVIADYFTLSSVEQNVVKITTLSLPIAAVNFILILKLICSRTEEYVLTVVLFTCS